MKTMMWILGCVALFWCVACYPADLPAPPAAPVGAQPAAASAFNWTMSYVSSHGNLVAGYGYEIGKGMKPEHGETIGLLADLFKSKAANTNYPWGLGIRYDLLNSQIATRQEFGVGFHQTIFKYPSWFQSHLGNIPILPSFTDFQYNVGVDTRPEILTGKKSVMFTVGASVKFGNQ